MKNDSDNINKKCMLCGDEASMFRSIICRNCGALCKDCTDIVLLFASIMPNAKFYVEHKRSELDETKMTALRIESLQNKGLF